MKDFIIRSAAIPDAPDIARVRIAGWRESYAGLMPQEILDKLDIAADAARVRKHMTDSTSSSLRFVAEQHGQVVAMAACGAVRDGSDDSRGEVYAIYLLDAAKKKGIGRALMREMAKALYAQRLASLQLSVLENNQPARTFYEKLGGQLIKSGTFKFDGHALPDVTYVWGDIRVLF